MSQDSGGADGGRAARERAWADWALRRWEWFPAGQEPRPLVMTGPVAWPEQGFGSGAEKLAFLHGDVKAAVPLPDGVLGLLREGAAPLPDPALRRWPGPLLIAEARRATVAFETDRGRREFPAWRLIGPDIKGPLWVLAPAVAARRWAPPEPAPPMPSEGQSQRSGSAALDRDGRTVRFTFTGGPPAFFDYPAAEAIETSQSVVVLSAERYIGPPGPVWLTTVGCPRTSVTVTLDRPLGHRVLLDLDASPISVLPADAEPESWARPPHQ